MCIHVCLCVGMCMTVCALCPWRTEEDVRLFKAVIMIVSHPTWAMGSKRRPSMWTACALNYWAVSAASLPQLALSLNGGGVLQNRVKILENKKVCPPPQHGLVPNSLEDLLCSGRTDRQCHLWWLTNILETRGDIDPTESLLFHSSHPQDPLGVGCADRKLAWLLR